MAYLTNTSVNGDLGVSGLVSVGSAGLKFTSGIINIFGTKNSGGTGNDSISIGSYASATGAKGIAIGYGAKATTGTNIGYAGSAGTALYLGYQGGAKYVYYSGSSGSITVSDKNDKADIQEIDNALEFIKKVKPITYVDNSRSLYSEEYNLEMYKEYNEEEHSKETKKGHRRHSGVLAQDVYESLKEVYGTDNYASIVNFNNYNNDNSEYYDQYTVAYSQFIPFLIKAIQEQDKEINDLKKEIERLKEDKA